MQLLSKMNARLVRILSILCLTITFLLLKWAMVSTSTIFSSYTSTSITFAKPPPEVAIQLTDAQLDVLRSAYESGFENPDPGGDDPCERLLLLPYKKFSTWKRQFQKRGFTIEKVQSILKDGRREIFIHPEKGTRFTKIFDEVGNWIVIDFVDCILWQVAPHNFK
ncbi:MAG: hypothetical protein AAF798_16500 [Bacteroidota bacterium]